MARKWRSTKTASALLLLAFLGSRAVPAEPEDPPKAGTRVTTEKDGSKTRVKVEQDVSVKIELKQKPTAACAATIDYEYQQRDTAAHVEGSIENTTCAASSGEYVLAATIRAANGEVSTLEFPQRWARTDDQSVKLMHDLPIGPNVDLVNVRTRRVRCTCAEAPAATP
jgi:hypothetical protein